jgi:hypothetical protein
MFWSVPGGGYPAILAPRFNIVFLNLTYCFVRNAVNIIKFNNPGSCDFLLLFDRLRKQEKRYRL